VREYYNFRIDRSALPWIVDTRQVFRELMVDVDSGNTAPDVAGKFHATMALAIVETLEALRDETGINRVALSGGVFQNELLTGWVIEGLKASGFQPHIHRRVPCNDGGVSLGQAVIAANKYNR
jgi:hydrogenase maturation protein HypF